MEAFSCLVCKYGRFAPPPNENNKLVIQFPFLIASFISCRINSATWESFKSKKTILKKKNYTSAPFSSFFPLLFLLHLGSLMHKFWAGLFRIDPAQCNTQNESKGVRVDFPYVSVTRPSFLLSSFSLCDLSGTIYWCFLLHIHLSRVKLRPLDMPWREGIEISILINMQIFWCIAW